MFLDWVTSVGWADWFALFWLVASWAGYGWLAETSKMASRGLVEVVHEYRLEWAKAMIARDNRVSDVSLISNLVNSVSFYANTTIYIIAGLFAVLGTMDKLIDVTLELPFSKGVSQNALEMKVLVLIAVFVFAYFKFTWSLRQFNVLAILVGASPDRHADKPVVDKHAVRVASVSTLAGDEFNRGIRAYYFGIATVTWVMSAWVFVACTTVIWYVLYQRDFRSPVLKGLM